MKCTTHNFHVNIYYTSASTYNIAAIFTSDVKIVILTSDVKIVDYFYVGRNDSEPTIVTSDVTITIFTSDVTIAGPLFLRRT